MQLVVRQQDGTLFFNWEILPEKIKANRTLIEKLFEELQKKFPIDTLVTSKEVFEMNKYVISRIKSELEQERKHVNIRQQ